MYAIFVMVELARLKGIIDAELELDLTWEKGIHLYNEFDKSPFNKETVGEYDCIHNFLEDKVNNQFDTNN